MILAAAAVVSWPWVQAGRHLSDARRALREADPPAAMQALEAAAATEPDRAEVQYLLAVANRRAGRLDRVEPLLRRASELGWPGDDIQRQRWLATAQAGDVAAVQGQLMETIGGASDAAAEEIYEAMAKGYLASYRLREAWWCLDCWLRWRPEAIQARMMRAYIYERVRKREAAADEYRAVLGQSPDHRDAHVKLGQVLLDANQLEEAREHFAASLSAAPDDVEALIGMAGCEGRLEDAAEAHRHIRAALALDLTPSQRALALAELGRLLLAGGKAEAAVEALSEAVRLAPADFESHYALGMALARAGQPERAIRHLEHSRQLRSQCARVDEIRLRLIDSPDNADLRCEAGTILIQQGLAREGVGWLLTALKCDPNHRKTHELLAGYYAESGDRQSAGRHRLLAAGSRAEKQPSQPK